MDDGESKGRETLKSAIGSEGEELLIFRRLAEASGYGFCVADLKGNITYANRALCRLVGEQAPRDAVGKNLVAYYPEDVKEAFAISIIPLVVKEGQWVGELPLRSVAGAVTPTIQNLFVVRGEGGAAPYIANLVIDNADRKRAEDALRKSEEKYRNLVENINDAIYTIDEGGVVTYVSRAIETFTGYTADEVIGHPLADFLVQDDRENLAKDLDAALSGNPPGPREYRVLTKSVSICWVRTVIRPTVADGRVVGTQGLLTDVTDRKRTEEALQKSEEKFSKAFKMSPHSIMITRLTDGQILDVNDSFLRITGHDRNEVVGHPASEHVVWDRAGGWETFARTLEATGRVVDEEGLILRKTGRSRPQLISSRSLELDGAHCAITICRDRGRLRRAQELDRIQRELEDQMRRAEGRDKILNSCLRYALTVSEMDSGGIYLVDPKSGDLTLACSTGLSPEFVAHSSFYPASSHQAQVARNQDPVYTSHQDSGVPMTEVRLRERLRALAIVPLTHGGDTVAVLNVASHVLKEVPVDARRALDEMTSRISCAVYVATAGDALRASEDQLRTALHTVLEAAAESAILTDEEGRIQFVNPAFTRTFGYRSSEAVGKTVEEVLHVSTGTESEPSGASAIRRVELKGARRDGTRFEGTAAITPILDSAGRLLHSVAFIRFEEAQTHIG